MSVPVVSVVCLTYNHSRYIRQCLDGLVMQKTSFPFEIIIHDDASTDGTTEIVAEYANKFSDIIRPIFQKENQWRLGKTLSKTFIYPKIRGRYVAFCEGDDYWTDPLKLQKQITLLEARPDATICFHPVTVHWENGEYQDSLYPSSNLRYRKVELELSDLLKRNFIPTTSVVYRWRFHKDCLDIIPSGIMPGDWFLHLLHAQIGKILFLDSNMGVYRKHVGGVWYDAMKTKSWLKSNYVSQIRFYEAVERAFDADFKDEKIELLVTCYYQAQKANDKQWLSRLRKDYPIDENYLNVSHLKLSFWRLIAGCSFGALRKYATLHKRINKRCLEIDRPR